MALYNSRITGIRRKMSTRKPRTMRRPVVMPVPSGSWKVEHGMTTPTYLKPVKLRSTSMLELTSSWRSNVSDRYSPSQTTIGADFG